MAPVTKNEPAVQNENNNNQLQGQVATTESAATSTEEQADTSNWKTCQSKKFGIQFKYPNSWGECKDNGDFLLMKTDYRPYDVYLKARIEKNNDSDKKVFKDRRAGLHYTKIEFGEIFDVGGCGGALACTGAILNDDIYMVSWFIENNQLVPKNWDGVWTPDNNIDYGIVWNILKTIKEGSKS